MLAAALIASLLAPQSVPASPTLTTLAEQSAYTRTGRYDEVITLCHAFESRFRGRAKCHRFGTTPEGRPMLALVFSDDGTLDAKSARSRGRPVVFFQGGIHAGEIDGKDAGFALMRDVLEGKAAPGVLKKVTAVFVPVFNIDGHERFGPNNRPNQRGPVEMGWRTNAQNLNMNRDYVKAESPEMQALLRFLLEWDPIVYLDLHVTDGADFQPDVAVMMEPRLTGPAAMAETGRKLHAEVLERLVKDGHKPLPYYPSFEKEDDPSSGFGVGIAPPRFSNAYWALRNRYGVLVETHSWKDYATRVKATRDVVAAYLELVARDGKELLARSAKADTGDRKLPLGDVPLSHDHNGVPKTIRFPGYAYRREPSAISGALRIVYDPAKPLDWEIPYYDTLKVIASVRAPAAGYIVPAGFAALIKEKLTLHGLRFTVVGKELAAQDVEVFRATEKKFGTEPYEGRMTAQLKGEWQAARRNIGPGSLFVPVAQPGGRLIVHMMEPTARDSFASWGYFNAAFEQKEYMENYVVEQVAPAMLERDPALRAEFEKLMMSDPDFARSAEKRLRFFYRRHPTIDERLDLYPVYRVARAP